MNNSFQVCISIREKKLNASVYQICILWQSTNCGDVLLWLSCEEECLWTCYRIILIVDMGYFVENSQHSQFRKKTGKISTVMVCTDVLGLYFCAYRALYFIIDSVNESGPQSKEATSPSENMGKPTVPKGGGPLQVTDRKSVV